jgi:hypothetical protein
MLVAAGWAKDDMDKPGYKAKPKGEDLEALHKEALEDFRLCQDAEKESREAGLDDLKFGRLGKQWHPEDEARRAAERRPCMTFNRMPTFIRAVVNEGRQNKPAIKVHPADDKADPATAEVINGLIRNIEYTSNADQAYDTGLDFAASCGMGYWRVDLQYACDDSFELDLVIERIANPFSVYGDYDSNSADGSDWNRAFLVDTIGKEDFEAKYKGKEKVDWDADSYKNMPDAWREGDKIVIAEYWRRREVPGKIAQLSDGRVVDAKWLEEPVPDVEGLTNSMLLESEGIQVVGERETKTYKVTQYILNGTEVLEANEWAGKFIPIIPVYGEEVNIEGKRYYRSLIRDAKDAQRNFNYWRTTTTELVALAPKAPWIGAVGQFDTDSDNWASANTQSHAKLEYDPVEGAPPPQRQPFAGVPAGALQEALNASDDMKATIGIFDPSLGARSNETSGVAINARKTQASNNTFHFIDNQARAIRHTGRILIDLIPKVYNKARMIRVMGEDKTPQNVPINQQAPQQDPTQQGMAQAYNLTIGKYDLTVDTGPGFQTRREEAAFGMTELVRAFPPAAAVIAPHLAKVQDWPGAKEIADELKAISPNAGPNPQMQQMQGQLQQAGQQLQQLQQQLNDKQMEMAIEQQKVDIDRHKAETDRLKVVLDAKQMEQQLLQQTVQNASQSPDIAPGGPPQNAGPPSQPNSPEPPQGGFFSPDESQSGAPVQQPPP